MDIAGIPAVKIIDERDIDVPLDKRIRETLCTVFPDWRNIFQEHRMWHSTKPLFTAVAEEDSGKIAGHIAAVVRSITTTWNFRYNVISIQGVCVVSEYRHRGLAHQLLQNVLEESKRRQFLFAILYCKEPLVNFYTSQGWHLADESVVMWNQRDLPIAMRSNCPMYYELSGVPFPDDGPLDVHSPSW
ncbi:MAG: GNAT family N-acetyltransferase [Planctomycetaceae bacterium]|jgi:GNAT superfamily N-acetyltransferase|nr:GNAT family N-acetyltransferase [Planctomycetaceae bacterium]